MTTPEFPWQQNTYKTWLENFEGVSPFSVRWPWAPFHTIGIRALTYLAKSEILQNGSLEALLDDLSCPAPPAHLTKVFKRANLLDDSGRIAALDSGIFIRETLSLAQGDIARFKKADLVLPTIKELRHFRPELLSQWTPVFNEDLGLLSNWLSKKKALKESFHGRSVWEQLELFEDLGGVSKSSTLLNFQRIYTSPT